LEIIVMRRNRLLLTVFLLALMLALGTSAYASTVWNPAATGKWGVAANWTNGVPVAVAPGEIKAVFNVQ
jgi:hypothetical protein